MNTEDFAQYLADLDAAQRRHEVLTRRARIVEYWDSRAQALHSRPTTKQYGQAQMEFFQGAHAADPDAVTSVAIAFIAGVGRDMRTDFHPYRNLDFKVGV